MKKNEQILITAIAAFVIVIGIVAYVFRDQLFSKVSVQPETALNSNTNNESQQQTIGENKYASLKGDAFDETYIAEMLAHHEGAVNMAEQAQAAAAREEIRMLAGTITADQSREMAQMRQWQQDWGFEMTNSAGHMSHGGGGSDMAGDMMEMQNSLNGLAGEAFDREFLTQMILHHEQAIEMSEPAASNASRQEIKDLASNVISTQKAEIEQMKQWQKEWGY